MHTYVSLCLDTQATGTSLLWDGQCQSKVSTEPEWPVEQVTRTWGIPSKPVCQHCIENRGSAGIESQCTLLCACVCLKEAVQSLSLSFYLSLSLSLPFRSWSLHREMNSSQSSTSTWTHFQRTSQNTRSFLSFWMLSSLEVLAQQFWLHFSNSVSCWIMLSIRKR